jgi:hypothetical protein
MSAHTKIQVTQQTTPSIFDLGWVVGRWKTDGPSEFEEHWMKASANLMLGMCRLVRDNQVKVLELCTIEQEGDSVFFRMRHFYRALDPWEEKPLTLRLTRWTETEAVFETISEKTSLDQLIYRKTGANTMTVHVGKPGSGAFDVHFHRMKIND